MIPAVRGFKAVFSSLFRALYHRGAFLGEAAPLIVKGEHRKAAILLPG